jgi:CRISPR type III-B/RAMP module RAMP protein Cmr6
MAHQNNQNWQRGGGHKRGGGRDFGEHRGNRGGTGGGQRPAPAPAPAPAAPAPTPPHAQKRTLTLLGGSTAANCENRSLRFERFTNPALKDEARRDFFTAALKNKIPTGDLNARRDAYGAFLKNIPDAVLLTSINRARLLLNMAGSVMENAGVSLDRLTGMPRIPGSAVKGAARRAAIQQLANTTSDTGTGSADKAALLADIALAFGWIEADWETKTSDKQTVINADGSESDAPTEDFFFACGSDTKIFAEVAAGARKIIAQKLIAGAGTGDAFDAPDPDNRALEKLFSTGGRLGQFAGAVSFFDALPAKAPATGTDLELDVLTSHHQEYYNGKRDDAYDTEDPIPVYFPAIAAGHEWTFALAPAPNIRIRFADKNEPARLRNRASDFLQSALTTFGIGAKTAAGYGWFSEKTNADFEQERLAEEARRTQIVAQQQASATTDKNKAAYQAQLDEQAFAQKVKQIASLPENEQRAIIQSFSAVSEEGKAKREKLKAWRKRNPDLVNLLATTAANLKEIFPK